jgi:DNA-binding winged helix-turn-helix (wHTH) protein
MDTAATIIEWSGHGARNAWCRYPLGVWSVTYTFGSLCIDAGARTLSSTERAVHLTRKAFDLLLLLIERQPNAVSKEQIYAHLWPDTFVAESAIQTLVHEIREAIDDRELQQSWICTVHGIGYRFAGHVLASNAAPSPTSPGRPAAWLLGESIRVALHAGENIVGRGLEDVIEVEAPTISRRHARIIIADSVTLEDLGSKNGTWLEDERLTAPRALADGDIVRRGSATFTFRLVRQPKSTKSVEIGRGDLDVTSG